MSGDWRVSYSLMSKLDSGYNFCFLYLNGQQQWATRHQTYSTGAMVQSTGGRVVTLEANAGDTISLRSTGMYGDYFFIHFCVEYVS